MTAIVKLFCVFVCAVCTTAVTVNATANVKMTQQTSRDGKFLDELGQLLDNAVFGKSYNNDESAVTCVDAKREQKWCPVWKKLGACKYRSWMRKYCAKTCDICSPPAPPIPVLPACARGNYGCCWDNKTMAKGPVDDLIASQCPPCLDMQRKEFCVEWSDKCNSKVKGQGDVMRVRCATTCGTPCKYNLNIHKPKCQDDDAYKTDCVQWFTEGKCVTDIATMRVLCPYSCGFCHTTSFVAVK